MDHLDDISSLNDAELFEFFDCMDEEENIEQDGTDSNHCNNCGSDNYIVVDTSNGFFVCEKCGSISRGLIDETAEWNSYGEGGVRGVNRCSMPINPLLPQSSLGTTIRASYGSCKIKTIHNWFAMPYKERSLHIVFKDIKEKCVKAKLFKCIIDGAIILYFNVSGCTHQHGENKGKQIIIRGKNRESLKAACVFYSCKRENKTRSHREIADIFGLSQKNITRGCKTFMKLIKIKKMNYDIKYSKPEHFIQRHCRKMHMDKQYILLSQSVTRNIHKLGIVTEHTPLSVASGSEL